MSKHRVHSRLVLLALAFCITASACATAAPRRGRVYAAYRPPPARVEVVSVAPGPHYVWVKGHYRWAGRAYAWLPGRWTRPARGYRAWQPGHWAHDRHGWFYVEGRWR